MAAAGLPVPASTLDRDPSLHPEPDPAMQATLLQVYRNEGPVQNLCESLVDLDEGVQEWRYRHVKSAPINK